MDLGLREKKGKGCLEFFITDSNSGHKKTERFQKTTCHTPASSGEKLSITVKAQEQGEVGHSSNYHTP